MERRLSTEPSPKAKSVDLVKLLNEDTSVAVAYWIGMLIGAGVLVLLWLESDDGPDYAVFALILTIWTSLLTAGLAVPILRRLPPRWCRVPAGERVLHLILG